MVTLRWAVATATCSLLGASCDACVPLGGFHFSVPQDDFGANLRNTEFLNEQERVMQDSPDPRSAKENLRHYASIAHMAGTAGDLEMAEFTVRKMKEFGLDKSKIHVQQAFLNYPVSRSLELVHPSGKVAFSAPMIEAELELDPTSNTPWRNMSFLAYGPTGTAQGPLVYANYGRPEDFDLLARHGVVVQGKIVITRYGECFRGLKAMNAQQRGAAGVLIYSDPADDGDKVGVVYPEGPWRPSDSIQRGSAQFNSLCAGDPGRANVFDECGYKTEELIPQIPVLPLSYGDAIPLLKALQRGTEGNHVPENWVGGLADRLGPGGYQFGPSPELVVRMAVNNTFTRTPIWNVITTIPGTSEETVVIGNHRDAWVFGAADPNSGSAIMLEVARGLGNLVKSGWRPRRTIVLGSWSGEEYGLLGSTGWAEEFAATTLKNAVVYLNTDVGVNGQKLKTSASPSLGRALRRALRKVSDPASGRSLADVWDNKLGTLGSGSDYTVFLDKLGIASVDLSFGRSNDKAYGVYHSIYDSYTWIETQADPEYKYHVAMAQLLGLLTLDFATSQVLPVSPQDLAKALGDYASEISSKARTLAIDPVVHAVDHFKSASLNFLAASGSWPARCVNLVLGNLEKQFLDPKGLPRRKWFKHILQSPGFYLGYAAQVFPGIQEAIDLKDEKLAAEMVQRVADVIMKAGDFFEQGFQCAKNDQVERVAEEEL